MNNPLEHHGFRDQEFAQDSSDHDRGSIETLFSSLDFPVTPDLEEATRAILAGLSEKTTDASLMRAAWIEYAKIVEQIVQSSNMTLENPDIYPTAQLAAILHKSLIFHAANQPLRYAMELDHAETITHHKGMEAIGTIIQGELEAVIEPLEMSPEVLLIKLKGSISELNRTLLRDQFEAGDTLEDMIGSAYGILIEEGEDPNAILTDLGILE